MISVFYDGGCGICSREIAYYKRLAAEHRFAWIDISRDPSQLSHINVTYETAMKHLHVQDDEDRVHTGIDAFIVMWAHLPYWTFASRIASIPHMKWLLAKAYDVFAEWRYRRLLAKSCLR